MYLIMELFKKCHDIHASLLDKPTIDAHFIFKSSNLSQSRSKIHNHKGLFTPTARVKAEVTVNPVSVRLKTSEAGWLCPPGLYGHFSVHSSVWLEETRDRDHIFFNVCLVFSHCEWRCRSNALICSPFSAGVTCRCTWGCCGNSSRLWHWKFLGMGRFLQHIWADSESGRAVQGSVMLQLTTGIQKSASLVTACRVQSQAL